MSEQIPHHRRRFRGHIASAEKTPSIRLDPVASQGDVLADKLRQTISDYRTRNDRPVVFTSKSVSEGHPDKVCDFIADSILDAHLAQDPRSEVACDVMCRDEHVVLAGEIISRARVNVEAVTRTAIRQIGYADTDSIFHADLVCIQNLIRTMLPDIATTPDGYEDPYTDHRLVVGFATRETPELLPLPICLAHRLTRGLDEIRKMQAHPWLRPDASAVVSVRYDHGKPVAVTDVNIGVQHAKEIKYPEFRAFVNDQLLPTTIGEWLRPELRVFANCTGRFTTGGPERECGMTGRKIAVDTYGGFARNTGGAFSGKDPSKAERTTSYFARFVARQIVKYEIASCAEIQIAYAIEERQPVSIKVDTRGTGDDRLAEEFARQFDYRVPAIIERFGLKRPIYRRTTNYGHFGKPDLPWEQDCVDR